MPDRAAAAPPGTFRARRFGRLNLEVRQSIGRVKHAAFIAFGLGVGLAISVGILLASGVEAANIFDEFVVLTFFDRLGLSSVLIECSPLILVGLSAAVAFRVNFWNIGIEGQFFWGAIGATVIAIFDVGPPATRIGLMLVFAIVGGFLWIAPPAILKIKLGVNEVISTLLLTLRRLSVRPQTRSTAPGRTPATASRIPKPSTRRSACRCWAGRRCISGS